MHDRSARDGSDGPAMTRAMTACRVPHERPCHTSMAAGQSPAESLRHRLERDRHVAFAFAAADLLIEVSNGGTIIAAAGAAQALLGMGVPGLTGMPILDFVAAADRPLARRLLKHVHAQLRIDPAVVELVRGDGVATSTLLGACRLPDRTTAYS